MFTKTNRFAFDWWVVQKRVIYLLVALFILCGLAAGGALYVWKYGNPREKCGDYRENSLGAALHIL